MELHKLNLTKLIKNGIKSTWFPLLLENRWKSFSASENETWNPYDSLLSLKIEEAYQHNRTEKGPPEIIINDGYRINFELMNQISIKQEYKRRPIKR